MRILLVPPTTAFGSKGDEAMILAAADYLMQNSNVQIDFLYQKPSMITKLLNKKQINLIHLDTFFKREIYAYNHAYILGADILGLYFGSLERIVKIAKNLIKFKIPINIMGLSYNPKPEIKFINELEKIISSDLVNFYCRDNLALDLFRNTFPNCRNINLASDVAFLLEPAINNDGTVKWITDRKKEGKNIIGINLHPQIKINYQTLIQRFSKFIKSCPDNFVFVFIPHDIRGSEQNDLQNLHKIFSNKSYYVNSRAVTAKNIKYITSLLDAIVSCRLHLSILSLGSETPCLGIDYNGNKTIGMFSTFDLDEYAISPEKTDQLYSHFMNLWNNRDKIKILIQQKLPNIIEKSKNNFRKNIIMLENRLEITVVGSYPKPEYLKIPDWFKDGMENYNVDHYNKFIQSNPDDLEKQIEKATQEVINEQIELGINIISDGEVRRENYIHYFCRFLQGFEFNQLRTILIRNGNFKYRAPMITSPIKHPGKSILANEWKMSQKMSSVPVKITIPGPMTILDTVYNDYYVNEEDAGLSLAIAIKEEIKYLFKAGCQYIQIDEPILAREPEKGLKYGIKHLEKCFEDTPKNIKKIIHICCGYPNHLDQDDYPKANHNAYHQLAPVLNESPFIDAVSLEDAHRKNDLSLFKKFDKTEVILGVVNISSTRIETVEEIKKRIEEVLKITKLLTISPDCGLAMLPKDICIKKLKNMHQAVTEIRNQKK